MRVCHSSYLITSHSVERFQLVSFNWSLVLVQVLQRVLGAVVVGIVVGIDGLGLKACNGVKLLDGSRTKTCQCTEHCPLDLCDLSILHCIHQCVLGLGGLVLQFSCSVLLAERGNLVEVLLGRFCLLRSLYLLNGRCNGGNRLGIEGI